MTNPRTASTAALAALLCLAVPSRAEELPVHDGDSVSGARLYRLHCASCHGRLGRGDGPLAGPLSPKPVDVRDGGTLFARSEMGMLRVLAGGAALGDGPSAMPAHVRGLSVLEMRDIMAWLEEPLPRLDTFFPLASEYIAHRQTIDQYGRERAQKALGEALPDDEIRAMVFTLFKPPDGEKHPGTLTLLPDEPAALFAAKPRRKVGFVLFLPLRWEGTTVRVVLGMNRRMELVKMETAGGGDEKSEKTRQRIAEQLKSFEGSGGRETRAVDVMDETKVPKELVREMQRVFTRALESIAMYEKEERDRFWSDPDAFRGMEAADMPEDVQFDLKNKGEKDRKGR